MLYLEDYLEMIEHLPQELRDRFTDMREMDLSIHNNMDELEKRVKIFFNECKRHQNSEIPPTVEAEFQAIRKEYYKTLEDGDEKVQLANQMYDLVEKYLRRLDSELHKFKCELEADNKGITEVLEKRSLELDTPVPGGNISSQQKENRYDSISSGSVRYSRPRSEKRRDSSASLQQYAEKRQVVTPNLVETRHPAASQNSSAVSSNITYNLGHTLGAGPAIAAAASQAIAATQQMQQGRRTASLKASYEAINPSGHGHEFIGRELAGAAQTAIQAVQQDHANSRKKQKRWTGGAQPAQAGPPATAGVAEAAQVAAAQKAAEAAAAEATYADWTDEPVDPNEPRYCLCNQVSYGDMVACDNQGCPTEWFHYSCVGITAPPKGKWYCPNCMSIKKRHRKN